MREPVAPSTGTKGEILMRRTYFIVVSIALMASIGGCSVVPLRQAASAEVIPCAAADIVITDGPGILVQSWTATCKGKTYRCSASAPGNGTYQNVSCRQ